MCFLPSARNGIVPEGPNSFVSIFKYLIFLLFFFWNMMATKGNRFTASEFVFALLFVTEREGLWEGDRRRAVLMSTSNSAELNPV